MIVFASKNNGKLCELQAMLPEWTIVPQEQPAIPEDGTSFVANALLKARYVAQYTDDHVIADDSGLVVDALGGAPGIFSARYAGAQVDFNANIAKLLHEMRDVKDRRARFECAMVLLRKAQEPIVCCGTWEGSILLQPRGHQGFGYDPIFFVPTHNCAAAELDRQVKNTISHRAIAVAKLKPYLTNASTS